MSERIRGTAILGAILALPLGAAWIAGKDLPEILSFPPKLHLPLDYPRFSWVAGLLVIAPYAWLAWAWWTETRSEEDRDHRPAVERVIRTQPLPWWAWLACCWTLAWWILAWSRFEWFRSFQRYTFAPLWLGFIVFVNGLTFARLGTCTMTRLRGRWFGLFVVSALFWWVFEWLNRFSNNWHYLGVGDFGAFAYVVHGSVCFSTVLPAVAAVTEWLTSWNGWSRTFAAGPRLAFLTHRKVGVSFIATALVALAGLGIDPLVFFPALWAAPLALFLGHDILSHQAAGLTGAVAGGDWRRAALWAAGALICGLFWEMWNFPCAAKWIYTVPYVDRWHFFEMPLLGYLGYLPFGLECYFVSKWTLGELVPFSTSASR